MRSAIALAAVAVLMFSGPALAKSGGGGGSGQSPPVSAGPTAAAPAGDIRISFDWAMTFDCGGPPMAFPVTGWPGTLHGALGLNEDRSYSIVLSYDYFLGMPWTLHFEGRLGGAPMQTRGGSAELRVAGQHGLRAIFHEPNNDLVFNVDADESGCRMTVDSQLHAGKADYTLYNGHNELDDLRFTHCSAVHTVAATCQAQ